MDNQEWQKRLSSILIISGLLALSIAGRLYQKTVLDHKAIAAEAESQYAYRKEVVGQRGDIVLKDGDSYYPIASNERRYQVLVVPNNIKDPADTAKKLAPVLQLPESDLAAKINTKRLYIPPIKHFVSREDADKIAALKLRGVLLLPELMRTYPEQGLAAQVLGFVNAEGKGNYGVEGAFDSVLQGISGYKMGEKDNQGRLIQIGEEVKAKDGAKLVLTLDREIQHYIEGALAAAVKDFEADSGTVIITKPKTGEIVAMASVPSFNPNAYNEIPTGQQSVFLNPAISSAWEPGSIMKPIIMALAIDKKLIEPETKGVFTASVRVLNHDIYTAEKKAYGEETMTQVLENSDNVGMVWIGDKLGTQGQYEGLKNFGFGVVPDFELGNVAGGSLPALKTWNDLTRATTSFGQGISVTPLQMVMAYGALANKGIMMKPYIVAQANDDKGALSTTQPKELGHIVSEETSQKVGLMLESVVLKGHGKRAAVAGYRVGGKTGTAQVPKPGGGYYEDRHDGSFAGYFPISDPQYAMVVRINNPKKTKFAESSAGPTFGDIAGWILRQKQVKPDKL